jgi:hypothetical protein
MKFKLPIKMWESLQPIIDKNIDIINAVSSDKYPFLLEHANPDSGFYFRLSIQSPGVYAVGLKPGGSSNVGPDSHGNKTEADIKSIFEMWIDILNRYEKQHTIYDDPVTVHQKYYEQQFAVNEPDAAYAPFDVPRLFILHEHLEYIKGYLEEKTNASPEALLIIEDCDKLIDELPSLSKNKVISKLALIWAKITKYSVKIGRGLWNGSLKTLKDALIQKAVDIGFDFINIPESL